MPNFTANIDDAPRTIEVSESDHALIEDMRWFFDNDDELAKSIIKGDGNRLHDALHEIADGRVSVYTHERFQWAVENWVLIAEYEDDLRASHGSDRPIHELIALCWYQAEYDQIVDALADIRAELLGTV